jgi:hypothetical protein
LRRDVGLPPACLNGGHRVEGHLGDVTEMVPIAAGFRALALAC